MHFILFVLIGLIAGALAGRVVSGHGYGLLGDLIVGVVGAFLGGWLFAVVFGVVGGGLFVSLLTAFVGAVILLWVIRLVALSDGRSEIRDKLGEVSSYADERTLSIVLDRVRHNRAEAKRITREWFRGLFR